MLKLSLAGLTAALLATTAAQAVVFPATVTPIALGAATYTQNFNTLASGPTNGSTNSILPAGFQVAELTGTQANDTYIVDNGGGTAASIYSYGATGDSERALGSLRSGSLATALFGAFFTNSQSAAITSLAIAYTGEQWRNGSASADVLFFEYSLDSTSIEAGTWTRVSALDFASPVAAGTTLDGNAAANRTAIAGTVTNLNIASGATFGIRWNDQPVTSGAQDGLAVDDLSISAIPAAVAAVPEPATWGMMIVGFALVGSAARRRRTARVTA